MPTLTATQLNDLVVSTLPELGELRFTDISFPLQNYTALNALTKVNRVSLESGKQIQFNLKVKLGQTARTVGLAASDIVNIPDTLTTGIADWKYATAAYSYIGQVIAMNREPRRILNYVSEQRYSTLTDLAILFEQQFWGAPAAATDNLSWWGVNTWFVKNATQGFNGGLPTGYTTIGGVDPTVYSGWNNYTDAYTNVSADDLIRKARRAATYTHFRPPVNQAQAAASYNTGDDYGFYTNYSVVGPLEENLDARNDNLGRDIAKNDGEVMFRRAPVHWVPQLDPDTTNPLYGINWGVFKTFILRGWWMKETMIPHYPGQHTLSAIFVDCTGNWICRDRRRNFVISNGTTYPN